MNYKESNLILQRIKAAKRILINCHLRPDPDSVASALGMVQALKSLSKKATVISPDPMAENLSFLPGYSSVYTSNYQSLDFSEYDLFLILDSGNKGVLGIPENVMPEIEMIKIDHHTQGDDFAHINLVDSQSSSTCEVLFNLFMDWNIDISKETATCLLTGIIADTGSFQFQGAVENTFVVASKLIHLGADKEEIILNLYRSDDLSLLKFWGEILNNLQTEKDFAWSAVDRKVYEKCGRPIEGKSSAASLFSRVVKGTKFGFIIVEEAKGKVTVSLRSRIEEFNVLKIAKELGGGGHKPAAAATINDMKFEDAVKKVLETARKHSGK